MKSIVGAGLIALSMLGSAVASEASATPPSATGDGTSSTVQPSETPPATVAAALNAHRSLRVLDAKIETAYGQALDRVSRYPKLAETLRSEQGYFSEYQDDALSFGHGNLKQLMQTWLPWLNAINAPRGGF